MTLGCAPALDDIALSRHRGFGDMAGNQTGVARISRVAAGGHARFGVLRRVVRPCVAVGRNRHRARHDVEVAGLIGEEIVRADVHISVEHRRPRLGRVVRHTVVAVRIIGGINELSFDLLARDNVVLIRLRTVRIRACELVTERAICQLVVAHQAGYNDVSVVARSNHRRGATRLNVRYHRQIPEAGRYIRSGRRRQRR